MEPEIDENADCGNTVYADMVGVNILDTQEDPGTECMLGGRERLTNIDISNNLVDKTIYNQMDVVGTHIVQGDFDAARLELAQINQSIEEGADAYYVAENLIEFHESVPNNIDNSGLVLSLKDIAYKNHPSSGYAQAFHYYLTGEFVDNLDLLFLGTEEIGERQAEFNQKILQPREINIFPNPASDYLNITNLYQIQSLRIYNSNGILVQEGASVSRINTQNWSGGIYIFAIQKVDGAFMTKKIIINK